MFHLGLLNFGFDIHNELSVMLWTGSNMQIALLKGVKWLLTCRPDSLSLVAIQVLLWALLVQMCPSKQQT